MKVLVAGGAGYIGSHTVKELLKEGFEVLIFDNFSTGSKELVSGGKVIEGDLHDKDTLDRIFEDNQFDAVLHFASLIQVGESYRNPHKYFANNLITSLNLLGAMLKHEVDRFIFSSSAAVYGNPVEIPITERHPVNPINPYGQTKGMVESILTEYSRAYGLNFISLRYFNAAGADPEGHLGEMHEPETHLIPNILLSLMQKTRKLEVYGTDFDTPDGTAVRDYIHVKDLAQAHVLALKKLLETDESHFINLGANKGYSVLEIIRTAERVTGEKVIFDAVSQRLGDVPILLASKEKAESILDWTLNYSDIETILETAWNWHSRKG
ncbi:UDP-glucose 4-epimerase GalE [Acidobacteriota bacterium]